MVLGYVRRHHELRRAHHVAVRRGLTKISPKLTVCNGFGFDFLLLNITSDGIRYDTTRSHGFIPRKLTIMVDFGIDSSDLGAHHALRTRSHLLLLVGRWVVRRRIIHHGNVSGPSGGVC